MTVKELIARLQQIPGDTLIVLAGNEEGSSFSPLSAVDTDSAYEADTTYSGEVRLRALTEELVEEGYTESDVADPERSVPCVCLWPLR